ncbi:MAG: glycosyltransferase [Bacteroidota bacterium]
MSDYLQIHPYTVIGFLALGLLIALGNSFFIHRLRRGISQSGSLPFVSILVPARNEALNIETCVRSLLAQDYPAFEVMVLDDGSTDETLSLLEGIQKENPKLDILSGTRLPGGWLGKHWACHQLSQAAAGELLLFTDADTRHEPYALRDSVSAFLENEVDLLTAFPHEQVVTWGERLTVPILGFAMFSFVPVFLARWRPFARLSITIGQFMLFRRTAYDAIGGYEAIRSHPVDDVTLGRRILSHGFKWLLVDGTDHIHCRMYHDFDSAVSGFTKNLFAFFDHHILLYLLAWLWIGCVFLEPLIVLLLNGLGTPPGYFPASLAWIAVLESLLLFALAYRRFRIPPYLVWLYPVSIILFVTLALRSLNFAWQGRHDWKDRSLPRPAIRL